MRPAAILLLLVTTSCAVAADVVGNWKGRVVVDLSSLPKSPDPHRMREIRDAVKRIEAGTLSVSIAGNKTYVAMTTGGLLKHGRDEGTWSMERNVITMRSKRGGTPDKFVVSADRRMMTMILPARNGLRGKLVLRRS